MEKSIKVNNKGFTLVELLVALAISSIILTAIGILVTNGVRGYNKQTTMSELQDEANLTMNHIVNAVMEADNIDLVQESSGPNTFVFITNDGNGKVAANKYMYDSDSKTLYVGGLLDNFTNASPLCVDVDSFKVQLTSNSLVYNNVPGVGIATVTGISDTVQFKVTLKLKISQSEREIVRYVNVRNKMTADTLKSTSATTDGNLIGSVYDDLVSKGILVD